MVEEAEAEIGAEFDRVLRSSLMSGMQMRELAERRQQERQRQTEQQGSRESANQQAVASNLRSDAYSQQFWNNASAERVADNLTVASELAKDHPAASSAYMQMSDVLRNEYGINIEHINRDHPTAGADRHQAILDALDDKLASSRLTGEAAAERGEAAEAREGAEADGEKSEAPGNDAPEQAGEAEATADGQRSEAVAMESEADAKGDRAADKRESESTNLRTAAEAGSEKHRDRQYTRADEAALGNVARTNPDAAQSRRASAQSFPKPASTAVRESRGNGSPTARKGSMAGAGVGRNSQTDRGR